MSDEQAAARAAEEASRNGDDPSRAEKREVPWLKGHLRDENSASKCLALKVQMPPVPVVENEVDAPAEMALAGAPQKIVQLALRRSAAHAADVSPPELCHFRS